MNTYTINCGLAIPATHDRNWGITAGANFTALDALGAIGPLAVSPAERPSASLNVRVAAGTYRKADGTAAAYAGTASQALGASATSYLYLTDGGTLTVSTTGWPASTAIVRLAVATTDAGTVTTIADARAPFASYGASTGGPFLPLAGGTLTGALTVSAGGLTLGDGLNLAVGTGTGTKLGTAAGQKLSVFGVSPVTQQGATTDLKTALVNFGLIVGAGATPLNLGGGTLTAGAVTIAAAGAVTLGAGSNLILDTATGTKIGTATGQKLSFWNATPAAQPASASQAALGALATTTLIDSTTGTPGTTLGDVGASYSQAGLNNALASLIAQVNNARADMAATRTLVNQLRADLVAIGLLKGSA